MKTGMLLLALAALIPSMSFGYDYYGAIAFSKSSGSYGTGANQATAAAAEAQALQYCADKSCVIVASFSNRCAALAVGDGNRYGWAGNFDYQLAEQRALAECQKRTTNCAQVTSFCSMGG